MPPFYVIYQVWWKKKSHGFAAAWGWLIKWWIFIWVKCMVWVLPRVVALLILDTLLEKSHHRHCSSPSVFRPIIPTPEETGSNYYSSRLCQCSLPRHEFKIDHIIDIYSLSNVFISCHLILIQITALITAALSLLLMDHSLSRCSLGTL